MNNQDLQPGEEVYYWEVGQDNYSFGTIEHNMHAYCLIKNDERVSPLAKVHNSRISRDRMEIVKLIANTPPDEIPVVEQNKPQQQMLLFG